MAEKIISYRIEVKGTSAQVQEIGKQEVAIKLLTQETNRLQKEQQELFDKGKDNTKQFRDNTKRIGENKVKLQELRTERIKNVKTVQQQINLQKTEANTIGKVNALLSIEKKRIQDLVVGSKGFNRIGKRIKDLETKQRDFNQQLGRGRTFVGEYAKGAVSAFQRVAVAVGGALIAFRAIQRVTGGAIEVIEDFDDSVANLQKTTGLSKEDALALARAINQIDTRTSIANLLALGSAAGRLGLEGEAIIDFTREVDKAFVALGDSLEGDAEEIGLTLGKLAANFDLEAQFGIGTAINKVGSVLNELGATSKAQEGPIVDFIKRLSGIAVQADISLPSIAALGALFDETGQSIEVSASTFAKLLPEIGKNVEKFAKVAGLDVKEFAKIVEEDAFEALKLVAVGAKSSEGGLIGLTQVLESFGIESARAAGVVGVLANNTDRLTELQKIANEAFEEGTSLTNEFNIQNNTLSATFAKASKAVDLFILGLDEGSGAISLTVGLLANVGIQLLSFATGTEKANEELNEQEKQARQVAEAIITLSKAVISITTGFVAYRTTLFVTTNQQRLLTIGTRLYSTVTGLLTGKVKIATIAQKAFNTVVKANPIGLIVGLLATAGAAFFAFSEDADDATDSQEKFNEAQLEGQRILAQARSIDEQLAVVDQLNKAQLEGLAQSIQQEIDANDKKNAIIKTQTNAEIDASDEKNTLLFKIAEDAKAQEDSLIEARISNEQGITLVQLNEGKKQLEQQQAIITERLKLLQLESSASKELTKEQIKLLEKRDKIRKDFLEERRLALLTEEQREIDALDKRIAILREAGVKEAEIERFSIERRAEIRKKFREKEAIEQVKALNSSIESFNRFIKLQILQEDERFLIELARLKGHNQDTEELEKFHQEKLIILKRQALDASKTILEEELLQTQASLEDIDFSDSVLSDQQKETLVLRIAEIKKALAELGVEFQNVSMSEDGERLTLGEQLGFTEEGLERIREGASEIQGILSQLQSINQANTQIKINDLNTETQVAVKSIDKQIRKAEEQGKSTEKLEKEKANLLERRTNQERKIRNAQSVELKKIQKLQAIISGAQAVIQVLSQPSLIPEPANTIFKVAQIIAVVAVTAKQIQVIESTPAFKGGGRMPGVFAGQDNMLIRVSPGEAIVNPEQQTRLGGAQAFRDAGVPGFQAGGLPLPTRQAGRVGGVTQVQTGISVEDAVEIVEAGVSTIRVEQLESEVSGVQNDVAQIESDSEF